MTRKHGYSEGVAVARNGKWKLRIKVGGQIVKRTFGSRQEAERVRDELKGGAKLNGLNVPPQAPPVTLGSVLDGYIAECETLSKSEAHVRSIRQAKAHLVAWRGEHADVGSLKRADLIDFVGWMKKNTRSKGRVIHNALTIVCTALKRAELPVPMKPELELPARRPKTLAKDDVEKLLAELPPGSVARTAVEIGLRTGARESEIRRLRVGDVDLDAGKLFLTRAKGKKGRRGSEEGVPIPGVLGRVLAAYVATLPTDLPADAPLLAVESSRGGHAVARHALKVGSLRRALEEACEEAGIGKRTTVGWTRAEHVTLSRENGATLKDASAGAGHADERVTLDHYDESRQREVERWAVREKLGAAMDNLIPFVPGKDAGKDGYTSGTLSTTIGQHPAKRGSRKPLKTQHGPVAQVDRATVS